MTNKIIVNGIFYLFLTLFFLYIFIKEKQIVKKINIKKEKFSNKLILKFGVQNELLKKIIIKVIFYTETIATAIILVLIIQKFYLGNFLVPTGSMIPEIVPKDRLFGNMVVYKFTKPKREDIVVFKEPIENKVLYTKRLMGLPGEKINIENERLLINGKVVSERKYLDMGEIRGKTWIIPKKGDKITIQPLKNYNAMFEERNIDIEEIQKYLLATPGAIAEILPQIEFKVNGEKTGMLLELIEDKEIIKKLIDGESIEIVLDKDFYMMLGDNTAGSYDSRMWGFVSEARIKGEIFFRFWPLNRITVL
jgi:signal peptidase I